MKHIRTARLFPAIALVAFIVISSVRTTPIAQGQPLPLLSIDPQKTKDSSLVPTSTFSINVNITNVVNLFGYEFKLAFDPAILRVPSVASIVVGDFFPTTYVWKKTLDNDAGLVWLGVTRPLGEVEGVSGNGTLATISFTVNDYGGSYLYLHETKLGDPGGSPIDHNTVSGVFANVLGPSSPVASFTFSPSEPLKDEPVTFDASATFDSDGYIANYTWDFGDGAAPTIVTDPRISQTAYTYTDMGEYTVTLTVTDDDGYIDATTKLVNVVSTRIYVEPTSGPVGTTVTVQGYGFPPGSWGELYFDDHFLTWMIHADADGRFDATFSVPLSTPGEHTVKVYVYEWFKTTFTVIDITPLDVIVDVGKIHFRGELAEFYVGTTFKGELVDAEISRATLRYANGTKSIDLTANVEYVTTGLHRIPFTIPCDPSEAPAGLFVLLVEAHYAPDPSLTTEFIDSRGASFNSFLLSPRLTQWNAWLTDIETIKTEVVNIKGELATITSTIGVIKTDVGNILMNLTEIKPKITEIKGTVVQINSTVGDMKADVSKIPNIETRITSIENKIATIEFRIISIEGNLTVVKGYLGTIKTDVFNIDANITAIQDNIATIATSIGTIETDIANLEAEIAAIQGDVATIQTNVGTIRVDIDNIKLRIVAVEGNLATIQTTLQTLNGTITSIEGDAATIQTDVGTIKAVLQGWAGATISVVTPQGIFKVLTLTTSTMEGLPTLSDNVITVSVSGETGTTGITHVVIPKQLLQALGSVIEEVSVTIDGNVVSSTPSEHYGSYVLRISYTHSSHTLEVYLMGILPTPIPLPTIIAIVVVGAVAVSAILYMLRKRKPQTTATEEQSETQFI